MRARKVLLADQFLGEEIHEQAIVEGAVRAEHIASHHTGRPEADLSYARMAAAIRRVRLVPAAA